MVILNKMNNFVSQCCLCVCTFRLFQLGGDLEDLESALNKSSQTRPLGSGSCSALIKLLPNHKDLLVSHDTWNTYQSMLRIIKKYNFEFQVSPVGNSLHTDNWLVIGDHGGFGTVLFF